MKTAAFILVLAFPLTSHSQDFSLLNEGRALNEKEQKLQKELAQKQLKILKAHAQNQRKGLETVYAETAKDCGRLKEVEPSVTKEDEAECIEFAQWSQQEMKKASDAQVKDLYALSITINENILSGKKALSQGELVDRLFNGEVAKNDLKAMSPDERKAHEKFVELLKDPNFQNAMEKLQKAQDSREEATTAEATTSVKKKNTKAQQ